MVTIRFSGGGNKPIGYGVTIEARKQGENYEGSASWNHFNGTCCLKLAITDGTFSTSDFQVTSSVSLEHARSIQEKGLGEEKIDYLEKLFRQVVAELQ